MYSIEIEPIILLQALSDRTRLRILKLLIENPDSEACLCDFVDSLREPEYNVSRHLKTLRQAGLVNAEKEGRWVYHRLIKDKHLKPYYDLVRAISDSDDMFKEDLRRFKDEIKKRNALRCSKDGSHFDRNKRNSRRGSSL